MLVFAKFSLDTQIETCLVKERRVALLHLGVLTEGGNDSFEDELNNLIPTKYRKPNIVVQSPNQLINQMTLEQKGLHQT